MRLNKIFLYTITAQLQAFRLVDTLPWMFFLFGPLKAKINLLHLSYIFVLTLYMVLTIFISSNTSSFIKVEIFFAMMIAASLFCSKEKLFLNRNLLAIIAVGLFVEDILINNFGIQSPFVRDIDGAFFVFREKSYFVITFFTLMAFSTRINWKSFGLLILIGVLCKSGLYWPFLILLMVSELSGKTIRKLIPMLTLILILFFYYLLVIFKDMPLLELISYTDILRFRINLQSFYSECSGTFFLHECTSKQKIIDLKNHHVFSAWKNISGQSPFFLLWNYFNLWIIPLIFVFSAGLLLKIKYFYRKSYILSLVLFSVFVQGFLLAPIFFLISINSRK